MEITVLSNMIIGCAIRVHSTLGPGLLESVHSPCLQMELQKGAFRSSARCRCPFNTMENNFPTHSAWI